MSAPPRPQFFEGQLLAAGDLGAQVDYARFADAVHARTQHTWGVVTGLAFRTVAQAAQDGSKYVDVYLEPGIAIDPSGRRIVVDAEQLLSTVDFAGLGVAGSNETAAMFPVYLLGVDQPQQSASAGNCATGSPTRVAETFQITFGRPGSESSVLAPAPIAFSAPPSTGLRVLGGYVSWNPNIAGGKFTAAAVTSATGTVRYAGVRAAEVVAPAGTVVLHTQDSGARFALALAEDGQGGCTLTFGKRQDNGAISQTFQVNEKGDVTFSGTWNVKLPAVPVVESGVIGHGLRVPLPAGVTEDAVTSGQFTAHVLVAPLALGLSQRTFGTVTQTAYPVQIHCTVDAERRVTSLVLWQSMSMSSNQQIASAPCQYMVVAAPSA